MDPRQMSLSPRPSTSLADQLADLDALMGDPAIGSDLTEARWTDLQALAQVHGLSLPSMARPGSPAITPAVVRVPAIPWYRRAAKRCESTIAKALLCHAGMWAVMHLGIPHDWAGPVQWTDWVSWPSLAMLGAASLNVRALGYWLDGLCGAAVEVLTDLNASAPARPNQDPQAWA